MVARFITRNINRMRKTYSVSTIRHNYDFTPLYLSPNFQFHDDDSAIRVVNPSFMLQKRWHTGHSHSHHDHHDLRSSKDGERIFRLGLAADIGLAASKAFAGYVCGSTAIIADAAHSISDVVLSGVALLSFKAARVPKDKEHPYGHGKFETLGALGISAVLLASAGGIGWHALDVLLGLWSAVPEVVNQSMTHLHVHEQHHSGSHHGIDMDHPILALNVTILSIAVKEGRMDIWSGIQKGPMLVEIRANCLDISFFNNDSEDLLTQDPEENRPQKGNARGNLEEGDDYEDATNIEGEGAQIDNNKDQ
ncbi:Metal tolerance protein C1 [Datura stramonium]|uniref:Metal tolerance protein C1 n=1 Tax=Datura stramonium TaxID=4076 RepID=A0ABS8RMT2_DATST|nr:Metal tolerance protein C1 [Datura stramonium]